MFVELKNISIITMQLFNYKYHSLFIIMQQFRIKQSIYLQKTVLSIENVNEHGRSQPAMVIEYVDVVTGEILSSLC